MILVVVAGLLSPSAAAESFDCEEVFLMFARGAGQDVGDSKETDVFFNEVAARLDAGIGVARRELGESSYGGKQYRAVGGVKNLIEAELEWLGRLLGGFYRLAVQDGAREASSYLNDRASVCDGEQWILGGYSEGAQVMGRALFDLSEAAVDKVAFVALFADPKLLVNGRGWYPKACRGDKRPWRRGNIYCFQDGGVLESRDPYVPAELEHRVGSWCHRRDGICNGAEFLVFDKHHGEYEKEEIPDAAAEAVERLN